MSKPKRIWLLIAGTVLILAVAAVLIRPYIVKESYREWRDDTLSKYMTEGSLYALSVLLHKLYPNTPIQTLDTFNDFEQYSNTRNALMFVADTSSDADTNQALLNWVHAGNHLVIAADRHGGAALLSSLNLSLIQIEPNAEDLAADGDTDKAQQLFRAYPEMDRRLAQNAPAAIHAYCERTWQHIAQRYNDLLRPYAPERHKNFIQDCSVNLSALTLPEADGRTLYVLSTPYPQHYAFQTENSTVPILMQAKSAYGTSLVRVHYGDGTMTFSNNDGLFAHPKEPTYLAADINRFDNAYLAAYLAQDKAQIFILNSLQSQKPPSLLPFWLQLMKQEPLLSLVLLLFIAAVIWQQAKRMGGKRRYDARSERQLIAHFAAQGQFVWRMQQQRQVLDRLQQELWQDWQRSLAGYTFQQQSQKINLLHRMTGASKADIALWLRPIPETVRRRDLLHYLRAHQRIRTKK